MRVLRVLALSLCIVVVVGLLTHAVAAHDDDEFDGEEEFPESDVIVLGDSDFDAKVMSGRWLIKFYAPWCGHCKALAPVWEEAATQLLGVAHIAKVDCTVHSGICSRYGVRGYPTLKYFVEGVPRDYRAGRSLQNIVDYAIRMAGPAVVTVDESNAAEFRAAEGTRFVLHIAQRNPAARDAFETVAERFRESSLFGITRDSAIAASFHMEEGVTALMAHKADESVVYDGDLDDAEALEAFVDIHRFALLPELTASNAADYTSANKMIALAIVNPRRKKKTDQYLDDLASIAIAKRGQFLFAWIDGTRWEKFAQDLGVGPKDLPHTVVWHPSESIHFHDPAVKDVKSILKFLKDVTDGKIEAQGSGTGIMATLKRTVVGIVDSIGPVGLAVLILVIMASCAGCLFLLLGEDEEGDVAPPSTRAPPSTTAPPTGKPKDD